MAKEVTDSTLWPLLHYQSDAIRFRQDEWAAYRQVNNIFAEKIATEIADGDVIWIHDYHLMLLPQMLSDAARKLNKRITIGFFLHTPFPSGDMFKVLPVWNEILEGILPCKTIGFHTQAYAQNFARTCCDYLYRSTKSFREAFQLTLNQEVQPEPYWIRKIW